MHCIAELVVIEAVAQSIEEYCVNRRLIFYERGEIAVLNKDYCLSALLNRL
jgi:hypothetical protein